MNTERPLEAYAYVSAFEKRESHNGMPICPYLVTLKCLEPDHICGLLPGLTIFKIQFDLVKFPLRL